MLNINNKTNALILVFIISLILCIIGSGSYPIYILDEAKNSEAAREMLFNNEFIIPLFNDALRTDKPPLHYYFMILGYKLFGINAIGARFFSGLFGALTITLAFFHIYKFSRKEIAWIFCFIIWSSVFFIQEFHLAVPDPYLIFFISTGLWLFYNFHFTRSKKILWLMYISFALGVLSKGPVAILIPGLICLLFFLFIKRLNWKTILEYKPFTGLFIILAIALPWYVLVHIKTEGAWTQGFFIDHNFNRFGSKMEGHGGVFLITWAFVLLGLMPFSFFSVYALKQAFKKRKNTFVFFTFIVCCVFIVFFSISGTKLPNYTMPCYPFLAFLISLSLWEIYVRKTNSKHITIVLILITLLAILLPIGAYFALNQESALQTSSTISFWLIPTAIITFIGCVLYFLHYYKKSFFTIASGWIILVPILFLIVYPELTKNSPTEKTKAVINTQNPIAVYQRFDAAFPINFKRTFRVLKNEKELTEFINNHTKAYIITNTRNPEKIKSRSDLEIILESKALFESHTTRIFKKRSP